MDRLACLTAFVSVVDNGGLTAAARQLNLAPSRVTRMTLSLEEQIGARLLNRTTRQCRVTEAGQLLYDRCRRILEELKAAEAEAGELHATTRGTIRLNTAPMLADHVSALISDYTAANELTSFELTVTDRMEGLVADGFDLAIHAGPLADSSLIVRRLGELPWAVYAAPSYLARREEILHPADLTRHNCLVYAPAWGDGAWTFEADNCVHGVRVSGNLRGNDLAVLRAVTLSGQGVALLPDNLVASDLRLGRLARVLEGYTFRALAVNAIFPSGRMLSRKVRSFVDFSVARFGALSAALPLQSETTAQPATAGRPRLARVA